MDPGAFALLGGVSFFAGVSRLTMSLAVIMVEITNDIQFLLLIMTTIMFAKERCKQKYVSLGDNYLEGYTLGPS